MDDLEPAVYETPNEKAFATRFPWGIAALVVATVLGITAYHHISTGNRVQALRQDIASRFQGNMPLVRERTDVLEAHLYEWAKAASGPAFIAADFSMDELQGRDGLYLRIHDSHLTSADTFAEGAKNMGEDAITRCLGLSPVSLRGFYHRLPFLESQWLDEALALESPSELELRLTQLKLRVERDLPILADATHASYVMMVVQHGSSRNEPVDVVVHRISSGELLLRARVQSRGGLITARIGSSHGQLPANLGSGAIDCSIASQLRALSGAGIPEVQNLPAAPTDHPGEPPAEVSHPPE